MTNDAREAKKNQRKEREHFENLTLAEVVDMCRERVSKARIGRLGHRLGTFWFSLRENTDERIFSVDDIASDDWAIWEFKEDKRWD